ncbi:BlaI/MecI/CopY family transcriptional regulator [Eubacteriales bacterium OttesenSCG-928-N14]|nr:BlaI/MecI/CopY family transcriptional regulator [Eubacteriales bacterium OttesenSCG-928-N14]
MKTLSNVEWVIMSALWEKPNQTISGILQTIGEELGWKYNTYVTYIKRMCEKGLIAYEQQGRDKFYYPAVQKSECIDAERKSLSSKLDEASTKEFLIAMIKQSALSKKDWAELGELLEQLSNEGDD